MHLKSPAIIFNVSDTAASCHFLQKHLAFEITAAGEGFTALGHKDHDLRIIFLPLVSGQVPGDNDYYQIGFLVTEIDSHWVSLKDQVKITDPIHTNDATKERSFQISDDNGIRYRLVEFV